MTFWFSVITSAENTIVVRVHVASSNPPSNKPVILQKMMELLSGEPGMFGRHEILRLAQEFPQEERMLRAIDNLFCHCRVKGVNGIHWNSDYGHSIHIETE